MEDRKICPVSFNLKDPFEVNLLKSTKNKGPFSKYIKRLILLDQGSLKLESLEQKPRKENNVNSFI